MPFCAICGRYHDPEVGCLDGTRDILHDTGTIPPPALSHREFRQVAKQADRWFLKLLLWALLVIVLLFVVASLVKKTF